MLPLFNLYDKCTVLFVISCVLLGLISLVKLKGNESEVALEDQYVELGLLPKSTAYPRTTQEFRQGLADRNHCKETLIYMLTDKKRIKK